MFAPVLSPPREIESIYAYIRVFKAFGYPPKTDVAGRSSCPEVHDPRSRSHGHDHCRRPHRPRTSRLPPYPCGCFRTPRTKCTAFRRPFLLQAVLILVPPERLTCLCLNSSTGWPSLLFFRLVFFTRYIGGNVVGRLLLTSLTGQRLYHGGYHG